MKKKIHEVIVVGSGLSSLTFIDAYLENLSKVFLDIVRFEDGENVMDKLEGPICHSGFARLN